MDILIRIILQTASWVIIGLLVVWIAKNLQRWFPRAENKGKEVKISRKGWYGVNPSVWDKLFLGIFISSIVFGMLGTLIISFYIQHIILKTFFSNPTDFFVTGYGLGLFPTLLFGLAFSSILFDPISDFFVEIIQKSTGKSREELLPAISNHNKLLGIDENKFKKFWLWVCLILFIVTIPGFFTYTCFSQEEIVQRSWPGLKERKYTYSQVLNIWHVKDFKNKLSGEIEPTTEHFIIEFSDGWQWSSTAIPPDFGLQKLTGNSMNIEEALNEVAKKSGNTIKLGVQNIDL